MKFLTYIQDVGRSASRSRRLAAPKPTFESAEEAVAASLEWEDAVTGHINDARGPGDRPQATTPRRRSSSGS